ncbi:DUF2283 domain-containing protein [Candidatus Saccharibacteria bacterium]|nr:DUF2283 domain-containing protein [Candidatus Saccharibacteria bacterium]
MIQNQEYIEQNQTFVFTYDQEANAAYIYTKQIDDGEVDKTYICEGLPESVKGGINLDFDSQGRLLGIEILDANKVAPHMIAKMR